LNSVISLILKHRDVRNIFPSLQNLTEEESIIIDELTSFAYKIRKEVCIVKESFLSFLRKFEENKAHNVLSLMLDPRFKSFHLVSSFIGKEQGVAIAKEYDKKSLYPMLLKCHHHLHHLGEIESSLANIGVDEDCSLDIFEQIANTSEPTKELVNRELLIFRGYQVDVKEIKCPLQWWQKHESMFPTMGFLARQILSIVGSHIETE
jgi:hypothetical protein